jgi:hypothetical protein
MHVCGTCASKLVQPVEWEQAGARHWQVTLHCPNCQWIGTGVFDDDEVEAFDEELDRGTGELISDLCSLEQVSFEQDVERFVAALEADLICADDFAVPRG